MRKVRSKSRAFAVKTSRVGLLALAFTIGYAQGGSCPTYTQATAGGQPVSGMSNDANIQVDFVNTSDGTWATGDDTGSPQDSAETGVGAWTSMSGSNQDVSAANYSGSLTETQLLETGTAANPVVVVVQMSPTTVASGSNPCGAAGVSSCTHPAVDGNNVIVAAIVYVDSAYVGNGTLPPDYDSTDLTHVLSHEIGVHADMGWQDCASGANCDNSAAGPGMYTTVGPTSCDVTQAQACGR